MTDHAVDNNTDNLYGHNMVKGTSAPHHDKPEVLKSLDMASEGNQVSPSLYFDSLPCLDCPHSFRKRSQRIVCLVLEITCGIRIVQSNKSEMFHNF